MKISAHILVDLLELPKGQLEIVGVPEGWPQNSKEWDEQRREFRNFLRKLEEVTGESFICRIDDRVAVITAVPEGDYDKKRIIRGLQKLKIPIELFRQGDGIEIEPYDQSCDQQ